MADDLDTLIARRDKLRKLRASGVRGISQGDVRTDLKSDSEMAAAEASLDAQIAALSPPSFAPIDSVKTSYSSD